MAGSRAVAPDAEQERRSDSTALPFRARSDRPRGVGPEGSRMERIFALRLDVARVVGIDYAPQDLDVL